MSKLYHQDGTSPTLYALAGDSPGTPANWLETTAQSLANAWSAQIGGASAALTPGTWDAYKQQYLAPLRTDGQIGDIEVTANPDPKVLEHLERIEAAILKPRTTTAG